VWLLRVFYIAIFDSFLVLMIYVNYRFSDKSFGLKNLSGFRNLTGLITLTFLNIYSGSKSVLTLTMSIGDCCLPLPHKTYASDKLPQMSKSDIAFVTPIFS
jgi:hypothetical protein